MRWRDVDARSFGDDRARTRDVTRRFERGIVEFGKCDNRGMFCDLTNTADRVGRATLGKIDIDEDRSGIV